MKFDKSNFFAQECNGVETVDFLKFGKVMLHALTYGEVSACFNGSKDQSEALLKLVIKSAKDEDGESIFSMKDMPELKSMPVAVVGKLTAAASKVNGVGAGSETILEDAKND